jgi:ketosteroid isomerase-like protein
LSSSPPIDRFHEALYKFYAGGESAPLRKLLEEDVEWHVPGASAIAGEYRGIEAVLEYFDKRRELSGQTFRMSAREVLAGDEHVAVITDGTVTLDGLERSWATVGLYRLRGERIAACWLLPLDPVAFDAIWSSY